MPGKRKLIWHPPFLNTIFYLLVKNGLPAASRFCCAPNERMFTLNE